MSLTVLKSANVVIPSFTCSICFAPCSENQITQLECSHVFHNECIDRWFLRKKTCPVCRKECRKKIPELSFQMDSSKLIQIGSQTYRVPTSTQVDISEIPIYHPVKELFDDESYEELN